MRVRRPSLATLGAISTAAVAFWLSAGALTVATLQSGTGRVGVVPSPAWLVGWLAVGLVLACLTHVDTRTNGLLLLSAMVILPWLPIPIPTAFLIWTGPLRIWLWAAIGVAIGAPLATRYAPATLREGITNPRHAPLLAAAIAASVYLGAAWQVFPRLPAGDEPHYLVITQSLLLDHDLKIANNHRRGDYHAYFGGDLKPDYLRAGKRGDIYSVHAPGLPAIVAPAFALLGYPGVLALLALLSGAATGLTWLTVWRITRDAGSSWFAWAATSLSAPFLFQAFTMYPDALGGAIVMIGVATLVRDDQPTSTRLFVTGTALSLLPWLHTRFALLAVATGCVLVGRWAVSPRRPRAALALLAVPTVSALAWLAFFYAIYGTPNPAAPYGGYTQSEIGNLLRGVPGLLFDQQFGLLPAAPVYLCALLGFIPLARRSPQLAVELLIIVLPYALTTSAYTMWWGGSSPPARFLVPILLPLAIPAAEWFAANRSAWMRTLNLAALMLSVLIAGTMAGADRGLLVFNTRDGRSLLLRWLSPVVDLTTGVPSLFTATPATALGQAAIWLLAIAVTAAVARILARHSPNASWLPAVVGLTGLATGMAALTMVWQGNHATPAITTTGTIALLHRLDPDAPQVAVRYSPLRRVAVGDLAATLTIAETTSTTRASGDPLAYLPRPVAAIYELDASLVHPVEGHINVIIDRQSGPLWSWSVDHVQGHWRQTFTLPTPASGLIVDTDPGTRQAISRISIRATRLLTSMERISDLEPERANRHGGAAVYLLGGHAYIEPTGTWVAGAAAAQLAIAPDATGPIRLFVRSAAAHNRVTLESGTWRDDLLLDAGEEKTITVPVDPGRAGALVRVSASAGARPSEVERGNADERLLGVWIETR